MQITWWLFFNPRLDRNQNRNFAYQLKVADLYNIHTGNLKKNSPKFLEKGSTCFITRTCNFTWDYNNSQDIRDQL